jgi:hypothetical protein
MHGDVGLHPVRIHRSKSHGMDSAGSRRLQLGCTCMCASMPASCSQLADMQCVADLPREVRRNHVAGGPAAVNNGMTLLVLLV